MFGPPVQLARVVDDLEAAATTLATDHAAGPFVVIERIELEWGRVGGAPCTFVHSSAYGWWGELMLELVRPDTGPPSPFHAPHAPLGGLHHVAVMVDDVSRTIERCAASGLGVVAHARTSSADGPGTEFAFVDTRASLGCLTEIYEPTERLTGFYDHVRSLSVGWRGDDPVRPLH